VESGNYAITLKSNETLAPQSLSYNGKKVSITLDGGTAERTVSATFTLFTINSGVTLTLGNNVSLQGRSSNTDSLVRVNGGGTLVMESGSKISGNSVDGSGGGVDVSGGTFSMSGGAISGNSASTGGGVYVSSSSSTFTMSNGTIYGSDASGTLKNTARSGGHAIYVNSSPAKIRNSTAGSDVRLDSKVSGSAGGWE
jgi:hypothetical protein